jgi:hypothetical protein
VVKAILLPPAPTLVPATCAQLRSPMLLPLLPPPPIILFPGLLLGSGWLRARDYRRLQALDSLEDRVSMRPAFFFLDAVNK